MNADKKNITKNMALEIFSTDSFLPINKKLLQKLGFEKTIYICNLIDKYKYFKNKEMLEEDSFFLTHEQQEKQTGMSEYLLRQNKKYFIELGILKTKLKGTPPKEFYQINLIQLIGFIFKEDPPPTSNENVENEDIKNHETLKTQRDNPKNSEGLSLLNLEGLSLLNLEGLYKENKYKENKYKENKYLLPLEKEKIKIKRTKSKSNKKENPPSNETEIQDFDFQEKITPSMFNSFWGIYPRKAAKGKAKTKWEQICKNKTAPTWEEIYSAVQNQKKTEQWKTEKYIPHPTTWLNQQRWLDDPEEMNRFSSTPEKEILISKKETSYADIIERRFKEKFSRIAFYDDCLYPAEELFPMSTRDELTDKLFFLYDQIGNDHKKHKYFSHRPGPLFLLGEYVSWLSGLEGRISMHLDYLDTGHKLFTRFRRIYAETDAFIRDPLTGETYLVD